MAKDNDIYAKVTNKIIADLEKGELTWRKPWSSETLGRRVTRPLRWQGIPYTGINILLLWMQATDMGYASPYWMTFKQAKDFNAHVRKGEKSATIVYADSYAKEGLAEDGTEETRTIHFLKEYHVFNAAQIEGLPEKFYALPETPRVNPEQRIEALERFFQQTKAKIVTGTMAAYFLGTDLIQMPPFECFENATAYYAVLAHELTHWTRHPTRLDRDLGRKVFGDEGYAKEELVAELGACFLAAELGFEPLPQEQHAAYIQTWLEVLQNDQRFIFHAAALAQRAVEFVNSLQTEASTTPEPTPAPQSIFTRDTRIPARPPLPAPGPKPAPPRPPAPFRPKL